MHQKYDVDAVPGTCYIQCPVVLGPAAAPPLLPGGSLWWALLDFTSGPFLGDHYTVIQGGA